MKKLALVFLMLQSGFLLAAADKAKNKPDPVEFTITVHVVSAGSQTYCDRGVCIAYQLLETVIDNQPVQLQGGGQVLPGLDVQGENVGILALGDYPARISHSIHGPKNPNSYDTYRLYDLLMPDGTARTYTVMRLGPAPSKP
jgi:hypothetical protein